MGVSADPALFQLPEDIAKGIKGKRVFITGSGKDRGLGQAFALAAGLNGAASVAVHFHNSYDDGIDTVEVIDQGGGHAFPVQCDVTNPKDVWAIRSYVINKMGGPPDVLICNSGLSEDGYLLGRAPKEIEGESPARRRARVRQAFVKNLTQSRRVVDTKQDGFLAMTHLWASEAVHAKTPLTICYISSRQAVDPGAGVPGYCAANWSVLILPKLLKVNLGKRGTLINAFSVGYPFIRTGMTQAYADNKRVFGRWQPRMLEPWEAAQALMQLLGRSGDELNDRFFQLNVDSADGDTDSADPAVKTHWSEMRIDVSEEAIPWSADAPLVLDGQK